MEDSPTMQEWRRLYDTAMRLKDMAPWQWMAETDVFGVQDPDTGELGFVSVMGSLGEHYAVSVYCGAEGLYGFWGIQAADASADPEHILEVPQLQASFEDRQYLRDRDRAVIKELGLKFRGRNAWPLFRSLRPGLVPWFLEAAEARFLTAALDQTLDVTPRFRENRTLLQPGKDENYLVRVPRRERTAITWEDRRMRVPAPEPVSIPIAMDLQLLEYARSLPHNHAVFEADLFMFPGAVREGDSRPYYPYMLLIVDVPSEFIVGSQLLKPEPTLQSMWGQVPLQFLQELAKAGSIPGQVKVRSTLLFQLLQPIAGELGFKLRQMQPLKHLPGIKESLFQRFG